MEILRFALLGIGTGAVYAILAQGLVLVYRGSGVINFAQGAFAMVGAYVYFELVVERGASKGVGLVGALVACAVIGAATHWLVVKPLQRSSAVARVTATLGVTLVLQSLAFLRFGHNPRALPSLLPTEPVTVFSEELTIAADRLVMLAIGLVVTVGLAILYRYSRFGITTTAVAENLTVSSSLGHSPDLISTVNWALGSALAGLGGVLIAPIVFLDPIGLVLLVVPALAAGLLGQFSSFPITFVMALAIGVVSSEVARFAPAPGWANAAPFIAVVVVLVIRGQVIPLRSFVLDRQPSIGDGRINPFVLAAAAAAAVAAIFGLDVTWEPFITASFAVAIICISVVVITGYAGQLSLAQSVLAGVGALAAAKIAGGSGSLILAIAVGGGAAAAAGLLIGLPSLRTRGVTLAIATLGLSASLSSVILRNFDYNGGAQGIRLKPLTLVGWEIDPLFFGDRYSLVVLTALILIGVAVANLRRGPTGRQLLAMRSNERAAAALGVPAPALKAYAFCLSAAIAGIGGTLFAFMQPSVLVGVTPQFGVFAGILIVCVTVVGGVGRVGGAVVGSTLIVGGVVSKVLSGWGQIADFLPLVGGLTLLLVLVFQPDGAYASTCQAVARAWAILRRTGSKPGRVNQKRNYAVRPPDGRSPSPLEVRNLSVSFGGVHAVRDVSLVVQPGEIHGLIGPNGAGKTTFIDAVTGFVKPTAGAVTLGGVKITDWSARRRANHGLSRSFQSLELFDDLTVLENLAVASERPSPVRWILDLLLPKKLVLSTVADQAIKEFELLGIIDRKPTEISFGRRKTVAIARAMALSPTAILLDEPAAGLDDHEAGELAALITRLAREWGVGVLLVEHKVDMIMSISDTVTVLQHGAVIASGSPDEIVRDEAVIDAYLGDQALV
ncbi:MULTISPECIES: branched-chain amino acid ABC transporter permease/ATP-binding protein [unclassified Nocardioides]|uniref:branched-chain amino acid ABC transporter permease/ATP-binding protein n=1 Tax=unclassified Nocardioides TaxID=2615069 RepID=UPI0006F2F517|nr:MULTISPECIES: branched-chain amino acid ABC transporter permease/ATP-binding protein [unclassified Nocardioides]KRA31073.1 hypothetical protein ASD81_16425 [Nocardioides sp. Root614]KRA87693.1 hypothetical protein ASD84_16695 [Nocardioides sp. Root682]